MLKNRIFTILLMFALATPIMVNGEIFSEPLVNPAQEEQEEAVIPDTVEPTEPPVLNLTEEELNPNSYTFKQPASKRKIAKKFLLAMAGVGISSVILFLMLYLYNKLRENFIGGMVLPSKGNEEPLETPDNLTDAVRTFLDKTRWN